MTDCSYPWSLYGDFAIGSTECDINLNVITGLSITGVVGVSMLCINFTLRIIYFRSRHRKTSITDPLVMYPYCFLISQVFSIISCIFKIANPELYFVGLELNYSTLYNGYLLTTAITLNIIGRSYHYSLLVSIDYSMFALGAFTFQRVLMLFVQAFTSIVSDDDSNLIALAWKKYQVFHYIFFPLNIALYCPVLIVSFPEYNNSLGLLFFLSLGMM